jgi:DNA-binding NarL/FixJ family response regulator
MKNINTLIVEDDSIFSEILVDMLGGLAGKIHHSASSVAAREKVMTVKPNIIFLDNGLPGLNGGQLIQEFKELIPDCYIVMMSSFSNVGEIAKCIQFGADDFISKEKFGPNELDKVLQKISKNKSSFDWGWLIPDIFKTQPSKNNHLAILEDDEIFTFHLKWILDKTHKNVVNSFVSSKKFFDFYQTKYPDIIFLDYFLPNCTGDELILAIQEKMPETKIVMISSQEDVSTAINLKRKGVYNYISKNKNWREQLSAVMTGLII